jgi:hypothetical protein
MSRKCGPLTEMKLVDPSFGRRSAMTSAALLWRLRRRSARSCRAPRSYERDAIIRSRAGPSSIVAAWS